MSTDYDWNKSVVHPVCELPCKGFGFGGFCLFSPINQEKSRTFWNKWMINTKLHRVCIHEGGIQCTWQVTTTRSRKLVQNRSFLETSYSRIFYSFTRSSDPISCSDLQCQIRSYINGTVKKWMWTPLWDLLCIHS